MQGKEDLNNKTLVVLLAGFLGSGKTTLLRHILEWKSASHDIAVIVNEFGEIGIDGSLVKGSDAEIIELTSGCICCSLKTDLKATLLEIHQKYLPRKILIEASGVSDPEMIVSLFEDTELNAWATIHKTVTVIDAAMWEAREAFGELFYNQLKTAQLILLNKVDLIPPEKTVHFLQDIHKIIPGVEVIPTSNCNLNEQSLWGGTIFVSNPKPEIGLMQDLLPSAPVTFTNFTFESEYTLREDCFQGFLESLPFEIFRIKGHVKFQNRTMLLNFVGGQTDWTEWQKESHTTLTFIGWNEPDKGFLNRLECCLIIK